MLLPSGAISPMRQKISVSAPKASRFMKLPQRPMICPISSPNTTRSRKAGTGTFFFRLTAQMTMMPAMMPP